MTTETLWQMEENFWLKDAECRLADQRKTRADVVKNKQKTFQMRQGIH